MKLLKTRLKESKLLFHVSSFLCIQKKQLGVGHESPGLKIVSTPVMLRSASDLGFTVDRSHRDNTEGLLLSTNINNAGNQKWWMQINIDDFFWQGFRVSIGMSERSVSDNEIKIIKKNYLCERMNWKEESRPYVHQQPHPVKKIYFFIKIMTSKMTEHQYKIQPQK